MMTTPDPQPSVDVLDRAAEILRRMPVADGPSEAALGRILTALDPASGPRPPDPPGRRVAPWAIRSAAAAVLVASLGYMLTAWPSRPALAFADAVQKLRDARTLTYRGILQIAGQPERIAFRVLVKAPALIRSEVESDGSVTVVDGAGNRILVLDPKTRSALLLEGPASAADSGATNVAALQLGELRKLAEAKNESAGRRRIGAVEAEGFRVGEPGQEALVWVDPRAKVPLQIDLIIRANDVQVALSLTDFQFDPNLDDQLFRFQPPAGYVLSTGRNAAKSDDEAITDMLRTLANHHEGRFPRRFDDWSVYARGLPDNDLRGAANAEAVRLIQNMTRVQIFLIECRDYGYRPDGVKLGEAGKIVFWYRRKGLPRYRAIFGDLHAADVTADQLPERHRPQPQAN